MADTTTAPALSVLAELVLMASREGLPAPKYLTMSSTNAQLGLSLSTRAELDAWNAQVGGTHVFECERQPGALDVLVTTLHGGSLLGWSVDLNARVPLPLSEETVAGLAAVEADAKQIVAEVVAAPRRWRDCEGDEWEESGDRLRLAEPGVVSTKDRAFVEDVYGPLVEVQPDAEAVAERHCDDCGHAESRHSRLNCNGSTDTERCWCYAFRLPEVAP